MATQKSLVGTKTQVNLANAYVAESCAYSRYTFFAQAAQKESYFQYANILNETAANELRHAKIFLRYLDEANCKTKVAEEEGFTEIAKRFREIAEIENHHMDRFNTMIKRIEDDTVWKREKPIKWQCLVCGYIYEGTTPPKKCPACDHPYQHFMPEETNY